MELLHHHEASYSDNNGNKLVKNTNIAKLALLRCITWDEWMNQRLFSTCFFVCFRDTVCFSLSSYLELCMMWAVPEAPVILSQTSPVTQKPPSSVSCSSLIMLSVQEPIFPPCCLPSLFLGQAREHRVARRPNYDSFYSRGDGNYSSHLQSDPHGAGWPRPSRFD